MSYRVSAVPKSRHQIPQHYSDENDSFDDDWRNDSHEHQFQVQSFSEIFSNTQPQKYAYQGNQLFQISKKIRKESPQQKALQYHVEKAKIYKQREDLKSLLENVDGESKDLFDISCLNMFLRKNK